MDVDMVRSLVRIFIPLLIIVVYILGLFVKPDVADSLKEFAVPALAIYLAADGGARLAQRSSNGG